MAAAVAISRLSPRASPMRADVVPQSSPSLESLKNKSRQSMLARHLRPTRIFHPSRALLIISLSRETLVDPANSLCLPEGRLRTGLSRTVLQAWARSGATGSWKKRDALTNVPVYKQLQQGTQDNYRHALEMWDAFVTTLDDGWARDPNNYRTVKAFASFVATGTPGKEHGSKPSHASVVQCWKNLTAGWRWDRRGYIDPEVKTSTGNYIQGELQHDLELPL